MGVHKLHPSPKEGVEGVRQKEKKIAQSNSKRRALALGCGHPYYPQHSPIFTPTFWPSAATFTAEGHKKVESELIRLTLQGSLF